MLKKLNFIKILLFFLFTTSSAFAVTDAFSSGLNIVSVASFHDKSSVEDDVFSVAMQSTFKQSTFDVSGGIRFSEVDFQIMVNGHYWPLVFPKILLGVNGLFHFGNTHDLFYETDFHIGPSIEFIPVRFFSLFLDFSYAPKFTHIYAISNPNYLIDQEIAFKLGYRIFVKSQWKIEGAISSYENFSYPLFLWPNFSLSCTHYNPIGLIIGAKFGIQYSDMFTLTSYCDHVEFQFYAGYKF